MKRYRLLLFLWIGIFGLSGCQPIHFSLSKQTASKKILFDQGHGQTAGNADWTIEGGYSEFAEALRKAGYTVESTKDRFTLSLLQRYQVLILPEPNTNYSNEEKSAINQFIKNGGGVYFIADHADSDRNHDGWDSVDIFNGYKKDRYQPEQDWVGKTFGFFFSRKTLTQAPIESISPNVLTEKVNAVGCWACTTIQLTDKNQRITEDVNFTGQEKNYYHIHGIYGSGRFAAIVDSSPYDDGTGAPGKKLHPNWKQYDHARLAVNTIQWLARDR
ncbi:Gldg family protein [Thermoflavimicrobium dichotomicum]|uniref:Trehalose utilisation n=1 Tax=Thermoflavimicrobium dichotomicum TaxID=46223 RepID=A0A1I3UXD4_9BACL|nr:DUF4350 domain-containing protein [Thermoflavimicrobium dichotomicum]SFJ86531.1 Trehalose utilisation [Thermoflavimicrobium dichotomicum]